MFLGGEINGQHIKTAYSHFMQLHLRHDWERWKPASIQGLDVMWPNFRGLWLSFNLIGWSNSFWNSHVFHKYTKSLNFLDLTFCSSFPSLFLLCHTSVWTRTRCSSMAFIQEEYIPSSRNSFINSFCIGSTYCASVGLMTSGMDNMQKMV